MLNYLLVSLIFFFLGRYTATNQDIEKAKKLIKKGIKDRIGPVKRPTAEDIAKRGTKREETEEAMSDTFDNLLPK